MLSEPSGRRPSSNNTEALTLRLGYNFSMDSTFWDERFGRSGYAYGREPNDFLRAEAHRIPAGPVLCMAEGEGRNAVHLAKLGHPVTAVDFSAAGLRKAEQLATEQGVRLELVQADLATYRPPLASFAGVVSIWAHVPLAVRGPMYAHAIESLVPGGVLILEAYTPAQVALGTGGPRDPALLPSLADLRKELAGLDLVVARELEREVQEGALHGGRSATVQVVGIRR